MYPFAYQRAASVEEAGQALAANPEAKLLAGGMSLVPVMRYRLAAPEALVDLNRIPALREIVATEDGGVRIGAMATHVSVANSALVRERIPALAALAGRIGDPLVRNRGTIGGSLAHNDPAACYPCALLGLGGTVHTDRRSIPGDGFITGIFQTALEEGEIITSVTFPPPKVAAHIKFENFGSRFSIVGVFVARFGEAVRVGVTGAGAHAFRARALEARLSADFNPGVLDGLEWPADGLTSDVHAPAAYRAHLIVELTRRAVARCLGGE